MKDICTFETAKALKEAGFPQPAPAAGQFCYDKKGHLSVILKADQYYSNVGYLNNDGTIIEKNSDLIHAPTATDILRAFTPEDWVRVWNGNPLEMKAFLEDVEKIAVAWLNIKIDQLWQEMSDRIPAQGEVRDNFNSAKKLFVTAKEAVSLLNNGDFDGVLNLFERHTMKDFPPGGISSD